MKCKHCGKPLEVDPSGTLAHKAWPFFIHCELMQGVAGHTIATVADAIVVWHEEPVPHFTGPLQKSQQICGDFDT